MAEHRCDPQVRLIECPGHGPVTLARTLRLLLSYYDDGLDGNAEAVIAEVGDCARCWFAVAMGSVGTAISLLRTLEAERVEDPRPSLEAHLAAVLDQIGRQEPPR